MKLLKKFLMASLCSLMVLSTSMTSFAGVIGKSSSKYPKVVMGAPADADTYEGTDCHHTFYTDVYHTASLGKA